MEASHRLPALWNTWLEPAANWAGVSNKPHSSWLPLMGLGDIKRCVCTPRGDGKGEGRGGQYWGLVSFDFYHHTDRQPIIHISDEAAGIFTAICEHMYAEYSGQDYGRFTVLQCQLITFLVHAQRHYNEALHSTPMSAADKLIKQYLQLIDDHFLEIKNIHAYAQALGVTAGHLSDAIRENLGTTPIQLLNKRIALEAKRELLHSEQTIAEIALALNFANPNYFSRFFKREVGLTPSEFRRHFREKYQNTRS